MFPAPPRLLAVAACLCLAPHGTAALADPASPTAKPVIPAPEERSSEAVPPPAPAETAVEEDKRICKSVRADPSSRRKTRVCRTMEEWRALNIPT